MIISLMLYDVIIMFDQVFGISNVNFYHFKLYYSLYFEQTINNFFYFLINRGQLISNIIYQEIGL